MKRNLSWGGGREANEIEAKAKTAATNRPVAIVTAKILQKWERGIWLLYICTTFAAKVQLLAWVAKFYQGYICSNPYDTHKTNWLEGFIFEKWIKTCLWIVQEMANFLSAWLKKYILQVWQAEAAERVCKWNESVIFLSINFIYGSVKHLRGYFLHSITFRCWQLIWIRSSSHSPLTF